MSIPASIATGGHATDAELVDMQNAVLALLAMFSAQPGNAGTATTVLHGAAAGFAGVDLANDAAANQGTTTTLLHGNAAGQPSFAAVSLTADVSGILPTANGGSGVATNPSAEYNTVAGQSIPSGGSTIINYDTKVKDTDNAVTTGAAWKFTCPTGKGGDYLVTANANYVLSPGTNPALLLFKNGVQAADLFNPIGGAAFGATTGIAGAAIVTLAAGDTISVLTFQNSGGARSLSANAYQNRIFIKRLG